MLKQLGKKLGVTTFWKNEQFSNYFFTFSSIMLCFYFLIKNWLRKSRFLLLFFNLKEFSSKTLVSVGIYRFRQKPKKNKSIGPSQIKKIKKYRWRRKPTSIVAVDRQNRLGIRTYSYATVSFLDFLKKKKKKQKNTVIKEYSLIKQKGKKPWHRRSYFSKKQCVLRWRRGLKKKKKLPLLTKKGKLPLSFKKRFFFKNKKKIMMRQWVFNNWKLLKCFTTNKIKKNIKTKHRRSFLKIRESLFWRKKSKRFFTGVSRSLNKKKIIFKKIKKNLKKNNSSFLSSFELLGKYKSLPGKKKKKKKKINITGPRVGLFYWKVKIFKKLRFLKKKSKALRLERKFSLFFKIRFFFKYFNVFKTLKVFYKKSNNFQKLLASRAIYNSKKQTTYFLKKVSVSIFKVLNKYWRQFKFLQQSFIDFVNVSNFSFFFLKADYLLSVVGKFLLRRQNISRLLKTFVRLLNFFYPIYCIPPINRSIRLNITGKLGGQRKRKFRNFLITVGDRGAAQKIAEPADFCFKGIWNYTGSFGLKSWIFGPSSHNF